MKKISQKEADGCACLAPKNSFIYTTQLSKSEADDCTCPSAGGRIRHAICAVGVESMSSRSDSSISAAIWLSSAVDK